MSRFIVLATVATALLLLVLTVAASTTFAAECQKDGDCVPATCCHPGFCVPKSRAPSCSSSDTCTSECQPFTLDCGGHCVCDQTMGKCEAIFGQGNFSSDLHGRLKHKKYGYYRAKVGSGFKHNKWH